MPEAENAFAAFVARAHADPAVIGLVLKGSQSHETMPTGHSDYDVHVVVADDAVTELHNLRSSQLDLMVLPLATYRTLGRPDGLYPWERYAFVNAKILFDRTGGVIADLIAERSRLSDDEARPMVDEFLDAYLNSLYRSLKSHRDGMPETAHLDAAESVPYLLTALFALDRRVRPYNKYLRWELERRPLGDPRWSADRLLGIVRRIVAEGDPAVQRVLFGDVEAVARAAGHGEILDGWGDDLTLMRAGQR
jgi:hypothetical protein